MDSSAGRWYRQLGELPAQLRHLEELSARLERQAASAHEAHRQRAEAEERLADAEERLRANVVQRQAVEASVRHHTELVEHAQRERLEAEERAAALGRELVALRESVIAAIRARGSRKAVQQLELALAGTAGVAAPVERRPPDGGDASTRESPATTSGARPAPAPVATSMEPAEPKPAVSGTQAAALSGMSASAWLAAAGESDEGLDDEDESAPDAEPDSRPATDSGSAAAGRRGSHRAETAPTEPVPQGRSVRLTPISKLGLLPAGEVVLTPGDVLEIRKGGHRFRFPLVEAATGVRVHGAPGQRRWRVELDHPEVGSVVIDSRLADPESFTRELRRIRPHVFG